ncbi:MAG: MBL fold metallo-hydrolase [Candidatus Heimdallarchaeota archaeon]|nr:MBL fold metallo-hydrolase [Candidatus Heimdallarchaeota archaeon]
MSIKKVTENVYAITDGSTRGNVSAFVLPNQIVFIDTGMSIPLLKQFREHVEKETGKKVSTVFLTHSHGDHVFGNQVFSDCKIITSNDTHEQMVASKETNWTPEKLEESIKNSEDPSALEGLRIVLANETYDNQYELKDENVKVIAKRTGGHTEGSSYVYCPNYKVLVAGDNLFNNSFPWGGSDSANPIKWIKTLKEYLSLGVKHFIPGHGPVSGKEKIEEFLKYLEKVTSEMKKLIEQGKAEEEIIEIVDKIDYYPPSRERWKEATLKKWYQVVANQ